MAATARWMEGRGTERRPEVDGQGVEDVVMVAVGSLTRQGSGGGGCGRGEINGALAARPLPWANTDPGGRHVDLAVYVHLLRPPLHGKGWPPTSFVAGLTRMKATRASGSGVAGPCGRDVRGGGLATTAAAQRRGGGRVTGGEPRGEDGAGCAACRRWRLGFGSLNLYATRRNDAHQIYRRWHAQPRSDDPYRFV